MLEKIIGTINNIVWSNALIIIAVLSGIYYSFSTKFIQIRLIKEMWRLLFVGKSSDKGVSSFQSFAIAISGRVGTGNIAGVATAIALGGPGAIFWMWIIAFLGASSAFIEATLGQLYKENIEGEYRGGPAYYIENGLGVKWFAVLFAIITLISMTLFMPSAQTKSIADGLETAFNIPPIATGIIVVFTLALIVIGGVKRIGNFAQIVVPFMAIFYILIAVIIIGMNIEKIPSIFNLIISSAIGVEATFGGIVGTAIMWGVKRGIYSNEAGQGSAPHAAAAAEVTHPAKQGLVQAFSVYVDTIFVCTATALMILFTFQYNVIHPSGGFITENLPGVEIGPVYTQMAIESQFPGFGKIFTAIALTFFAFTTLLAYYYMAETNASYLNKKGDKPWLIWIVRLALIFTTFYGALNTAGIVWDMGDIGVGIMAWLNFIAIFLLRKPALALLKDYENQKSKGIKEPLFYPEESKDFNYKNVDLWKKKTIK